MKSEIGVHNKKDQIKISQFTKFEVLSYRFQPRRRLSKIGKIRVWTFVWHLSQLGYCSMKHNQTW